MIRLRQAIESLEIDERQMAPLLLGVNPCAALALLGDLVGRVVHAHLRDRRLLKTWLSQGPEISV